jgi:hypothetical protein
MTSLDEVATIDQAIFQVAEFFSRRAGSAEVVFSAFNRRFFEDCDIGSETVYCPGS